MLFAAIAVAGDVPMAAQAASPALRPESADVRALLTEGMEQSSTFRELAARLSAGDLIVYLRFSRCQGGAPGCLLWASTTPGLRRVLIRIDPIGHSPSELTAVLAHELQHALEVADSPEIRDAASFEKAFAVRGWKGTHGFETQQAGEVTKRVAAEMGKGHARTIAGTVVIGDVDARMLAAALALLPRRPERIVMVDNKDLPPTMEGQQRELDAFVPRGSRVIYLRRQGQTLRAAEYSGGPSVLMLAVIIWHEMAHTEGFDERQAQEREEDLWQQFTGRGLVDGALGLTYLAELRRRR